MPDLCLLGPTVGGARVTNGLKSCLRRVPVQGARATAIDREFPRPVTALYLVHGAAKATSLVTRTFTENPGRTVIVGWSWRFFWVSCWPA
jgi:hypothetical protein